MFAGCSIRFSLLPVEEQQRLWEAGGAAPAAAEPSFKPLHSVQLLSRHWRIWGRLEAGTRRVTDNVDGRGVIGAYPILTPGVGTHAALNECRLDVIKGCLWGLKICLASLFLACLSAPEAAFVHCS